MLILFSKNRVKETSNFFVASGVAFNDVKSVNQVK
jgi:hypothetical protein